MTTDLELSGNSGHYTRRKTLLLIHFILWIIRVYIIFIYVYSFDIFLKTYNFCRLWVFLTEELVQKILFKL